MNSTSSQPPAAGEAAHTAHAALPWKVDCSNEVFSDGEGGESFSEFLTIQDANGKTLCELPGHSQYARGSEMCRVEDANAAFIVRACNAHAGLVARLTELEEFVKIVASTKYAPDYLNDAERGEVMKEIRSSALTLIHCSENRAALAAAKEGQS